MSALRREGRLAEGAFLEGDGRTLACTRANLEQIRRGTMRRAREAVEAVEPQRLQELVLSRHHLLGPGAAGQAALPLALHRISLVPLPAQVLESDLLRPRVQGYQPGWLDDLVASGELLWTGAGKGRLILFSRGQQVDLARPGSAEDELSPEAEQVADALAGTGASFLADIQAQCGLGLADVQRSLWELVWAGRATNDRFESLRRGLALGFDPPRVQGNINPLTGRPSSFSHRRGRRPTFTGGRVATSPGPWSGRWALLPSTPAPPADDPADYEACLRRVVERQVDRHGAVTRELTARDPGATWSELYPLLCRLELCGELRRGMFVAGLGAAQFAPVEMVDRLRQGSPGREEAKPLLLNACDPALVAPTLGLEIPGGAALPRRPGNHAVLQGGRIMLASESLGRRIRIEADASPEEQNASIDALLQLLKRGHRAVRVEQVNGIPALESGVRPLLEQAGFSPDDGALEKRRLG